MKLGLKFRLVVSSVAIIAMSGCFNMYRNPGVAISSFEYDPGPGLGQLQADGEWNCPLWENIQVYQGRNLDGVGEFFACTHQTEVERIRIQGSTRGDGIVCVIPTNYVNGDLRFTRESSGDLVYQCALATYSDGTSVGTYYDFVEVPVQLPIQNFNSVVMVNSGDMGEMDSCIGPRAGDFNPFMCPEFSFGMVR